MCGICGEVTFDGSTPSVLAISRMSDTLAPRGPDDSGIVSYGNAGFGHRRLHRTRREVVLDLTALRHPGVQSVGFAFADDPLLGGIQRIGKGLLAVARSLDPDYRIRLQQVAGADTQIFERLPHPD